MFEEVSNDIIKPLTFDVAIPLINITIQSIGSLAVPLFREAFEQSSIILKAVSTVETVEEDGTQADVISRAMQAIDKARYEQKLKRLNENLLQSNRQMESSKAELPKTISEQSNLMNAYSELETKSADLENELKPVQR